MARSSISQSSLLCICSLSVNTKKSSILITSHSRGEVVSQTKSSSVSGKISLSILSLDNLVVLTVDSLTQGILADSVDFNVELSSMVVELLVATELAQASGIEASLLSHGGSSKNSDSDRLFHFFGLRLF